MRNKLELTLDQITPLLHFQADQAGACLRASEVKPRLDRFVLRWLARQGADPLPAGWAYEDGQGWTAMRYRLRFRALGRNAYPGDKPAHPLYFGNIGEKKGANSPSRRKTAAVFCGEGVRLTVFTLVKTTLERPVTLPNGKEAVELVEILEGLLPAFFSLYCFGTRSGKGFGSFEVRGAQADARTLDRLRPDGVTALYKLDASGWRWEYTYEDQLDDVYVLSALMKGGVNFSFGRPPVYVKGAIQALFAKKGLGTEKAYLKQRVFSPEDQQWYRTVVCKGRGGSSGGYKQYRYARAMLGLADGFAYGVGRGQRTFRVTAVRGEIERFANPVRFKPCRDGLLVLVDRIPEALYGAEFQFVGPKNVIPAPAREEFDLDAFVRDFLRPLAGGDEGFPEDWYHLLDARPVRLYRNTDHERDLDFRDTLERLYLVYGGDR